MKKIDMTTDANPKIKFSFISLFPDLIRHYVSDALLSKAAQNKILEFNVFNLREYSTNKYKSVDDTAYGGGDGMVFEMEPLVKCLEAVKAKSGEQKTQVIYLSPQGKKCDQKIICELAKQEHLIFICGRYAGIDQRFIAKYVDAEISIGDYVLSGGELPSLVLTEAISRQIPGVLGDQKSFEQDSFSDELNGLLEAPQFTRPLVYNQSTVPDILVSGHHQNILTWKKHISELVTLAKRPDLLAEASIKINWLETFEFYKSVSTADRLILKIENLEEKIMQQLAKNVFKDTHDRANT